MTKNTDKNNDKSKSKTTDTATKAAEANTDFQSGSSDEVTVTDAPEVPAVSTLPDLGKMQRSHSLVCEYKNFDQGVMERFFYMGIVPVHFRQNGELVKKDGVYLVDQTGKAWVNGNFELVQSLNKLYEKIEPGKVPTAVEITFTGKVDDKDAKGNKITISKFDVAVLK